MSNRRDASAVLAGVAAGFLSGLFGVGGGILMVPALVYMVGLPQREAHGTSLAAVVPIAVASTASYGLGGEVDWGIAALLAVGSAIGALLGTWMLQVVPQRSLGIIFAVVMIATAVRLVVGDTGGHQQHHLTFALTAGMLLGGIFAGSMAGLLGVGGGSILVPLMIVGLAMPTVTAKGTSLAVIVVTALVGTFSNRRRSNVDLRIGFIAGLAGVSSAFVGGLVSLDMPQRLANGLFAALLTFVALRMLRDVLRGPRSVSDRR